MLALGVESCRGPADSSSTVPGPSTRVAWEQMTGGQAAACCPLDVLTPSGAKAFLLPVLVDFNLSDLYYFVCRFGLISFHSKPLLVMREQGWSFSLFLTIQKDKTTIGS